MAVVPVVRVSPQAQGKMYLNQVKGRFLLILILIQETKF